jgi:hypothetical protein
MYDACSSVGKKHCRLNIYYDIMNDSFDFVAKTPCHLTHYSTMCDICGIVAKRPYNVTHYYDGMSDAWGFRSRCRICEEVAQMKLFQKEKNKTTLTIAITYISKMI